VPPSAQTLMLAGELGHVGKVVLPQFFNLCRGAALGVRQDRQRRATAQAAQERHSVEAVIGGVDG
jgi:hypothetical protein